MVKPRVSQRACSPPKVIPWRLSDLLWRDANTAKASLNCDPQDKENNSVLLLLFCGFCILGQVLYRNYPCFSLSERRD